MAKNKIETQDAIRLQNIFDNVQVGLLVVGKSGKIDSLNHKALSFFADRRENLVGRNLEAFLMETSQQLFRHYLQAFHSGAKAHDKPGCTVVLQNREGTTVSAELSFTASETAENDFFIAEFRNFSKPGAMEQILGKQKAQTTELKSQLQQEQELSEMKSRFLSIASHEFRTPLARILSSINLIERYMAATQDRRFTHRQKIETHLKNVKKSVQNLTDILDKFLSLGKVQSDDFQCNYEAFDVQEFFAKETKALQVLCKAGQKIELSHTGSQTQVRLDKILLRNILNNLISNAIKYSPENQDISVFVETSEKDLKMSVADRGIGIPAEEQKNLFRRFFRAKNASRYKGTGIGLSIAKRYVEKMNGSIDFESHSGKGTTFFVHFPRQAQGCAQKKQT